MTLHLKNNENRLLIRISFHKLEFIYLFKNEWTATPKGYGHSTRMLHCTKLSKAVLSHYEEFVSDADLRYSSPSAGDSHRVECHFFSRADSTLNCTVIQVREQNLKKELKWVTCVYVFILNLDQKTMQPTNNSSGPTEGSGLGSGRTYQKMEG